MITDEQVKIAECAYNHRSVAHSFSAAMRKALEAYEASKWVKFDVDDETTYPQTFSDDSTSENLLVDVGDYITLGYFMKDKQVRKWFDVFGDEVTCQVIKYQQPPTFGE